MQPLIPDILDLESEPPGYYQGKHYTEYVETVRALKRGAKHDEAAELLFSVISAVEAESEAGGASTSLAPWYYEQLAIECRRAKRYDVEIVVIERYLRLQTAPRSVTHQSLLQRLERTELLPQKQQGDSP